MDLEWMLEISSQSQCKWDKSYVLLEQQSIVVKEHYTRENSGKCWMSSITWWAKCLFFVQNSLRAWTIPIVQFGKQNSSSKFFLVKRWHFWTCFTLQMDMKVTEVPTISNLNFEERCFSTCFPSINDVWNFQYSTIKLDLMLKFWKSWIGRKNLNFSLC